MIQPRRVVARYVLARLTTKLKTIERQMAKGTWGDAQRVFADLMKLLGVKESAGEIGTIRTVGGEGADWYYALGPRQKNRAMQIVRDIVHLGRWTRDDDVAKRMAPQVADLTKEVAWLEKVMQKPSAEFKHGAFEVIPMKGVSRANVAGALDALDAAAKAIRPKFPKVLYGKVFISKSLGSQAASYTPDNLYLSVKAKNTVGDVYALCHELGHRYYHKFWKDKKARDQFWKLQEPVFEVLKFDKALRGKLADEFLGIMHERMAGRNQDPSDLLMQWLDYRGKAWMRATHTIAQEAMTGDEASEKKLRAEVIGEGNEVEVTTGKVVREPLYVTPYAAQKGSLSENFAEAFAHYVLGKKLHPEIAAIMAGLS